MDYKIKKGDRFLCLENYEMEPENDVIAYTKGNTYYSELDGSITDNQFSVNHVMEGQDDFFLFFKLL